MPILFNAKGMGKRRQRNIITFPWHISYSLYTSSEEDRQANSRLAGTSLMCPGNQHLPWSLPDLVLTPVGLFVLTLISVNSPTTSLTANILHLCYCQQTNHDFSNLELLILLSRSVLLCQKKSHIPT